MMATTRGQAKEFEKIPIQIAKPIKTLSLAKQHRYLSPRWKG